MMYLTRIIYSAQSQAGQWGENEIDYILFLRANLTLNPNWNEVKDLRYIGREELHNFVRSVKEDGSGVTPWFDLIARSLLPRWWDNLDKLDDFKNHDEIHRFI
jgi:isopentenyl-diphosphate delta-isomerase